MTALYTSSTPLQEGVYITYIIRGPNNGYMKCKSASSMKEVEEYIIKILNRLNHPVIINHRTRSSGSHL